MIYIIGRRYLEKKITKLIAPRDYVLIDGENYGVTCSDYSEAVSSKYNKCIIRGGFSPERETINLFVKKDKGKAIPDKKIARHMKEFFKDHQFISSALTAVKSQSAYGIDNDINVFVVVPTLVSKYAGSAIANKIQALIDIDPSELKFVYTEKELKQSKRVILENGLSKKELKKINKKLEKAFERFKHKLEKEDDDDF